MKFDIIIPFKDAEGHLPNICQDLELQTQQDFKVYFISDDSRDNSLSYLKSKFAFEHEVLFSEGIGPGAARNTGISKANGEYILFIDADDRIKPNYISKFFKKAVTRQPDIIECMYHAICPNGKILSSTNIESFISLSDRFQSLIEGTTPRLSWAKAFKRCHIMEREALFPPGIHNGEDHIFLLKAYTKTPHIEIIPEHLYSWVRHPNSLTNRNTTSKTVADFIKISEMKCELYQAHLAFDGEISEKILVFSRRTFKEARALQKKIRDESTSLELIKLMQDQLFRSDSLSIVRDTIKNDTTTYWGDVMGDLK